MPSHVPCRKRLATEADEGFLRRLFEETAASVQTLPPELRASLAAMQYAGRAMSYAAEYPDANNWILLNDLEAPVGRHLVLRTARGYRGLDLAILPEFQNRGFGAAALRAVQEDAHRNGGEVRLRVLKTNRALQLYLRLGFLPAAEDELAFEMLWTASNAEQSADYLE